ncbi:MAG: TRAP transporter small permease subunit [Alphaproteobacteria bacterium]|jgi:C4-dicarboxylate transporter DctQ subunit|nr:TRAP transporter small permease subunit [Alphaproteobacteria bacterium]MBT5728969.1 TRAP transporter small permease subunit [Alphaproteobacteria bacterium]MBT7220795.1 TRAP transporter small permease subunit [Alphaproteobacteria bacterium]
MFVHFEKYMLFLAWCAAWLFALAGIMLSYEVVARYFFLAPTSWAAELSQLCLIYGSLISMPWLLQHRRHIQINAVTDQMPPPAQRVSAIATMVLLTVFSLYVAFYGWEIFYDSFARGRTTGSLLDLPAWIAELPVAVCFLFLAVQAVLEIVKLLSGAPILRGASE